MGVNPELERQATTDRWLKGHLAGGSPVDEHLVVGVDEHGGFQSGDDRKHVDAVPSPCLGENTLSVEQMLVVHPAFFSGKASLFPGLVVQGEVGCIGKADHALTSGKVSEP